MEKVTVETEEVAWKSGNYNNWFGYAVIIKQLFFLGKFYITFIF